MSHALGKMIGRKIAEHREKERLDDVVKFAQTPKLWQSFVCDQLGKCEVIPRLRAFINTDFKKPRKMWESFWSMMLDLREPLDILQGRNPHLDSDWLLGYRVFWSAREDKEAMKAFEKGNAEPKDQYGNPRILSKICLSLQAITQCCYMGLGAIPTVAKLKETPYWAHHETVSKARASGQIVQLDFTKLLNPALGALDQLYSQIQALR